MVAAAFDDDDDDDDVVVAVVVVAVVVVGLVVVDDDVPHVVVDSPHVAADAPHVVVVAPHSGLHPLPPQSFYQQSRHFLHHLSHCLRGHVHCSCSMCRCGPTETHRPLLPTQCAPHGNNTVQKPAHTAMQNNAAAYPHTLSTPQPHHYLDPQHPRCTSQNKTRHQRMLCATTTQARQATKDEESCAKPHAIPMSDARIQRENSELLLALASIHRAQSMFAQAPLHSATETAATQQHWLCCS